MTRRKQAVLITGATGILGSCVLSEALARGYRTVALMRDKTLNQARQRLSAVLAVSSPSHDVHAVDVVLGDVRKRRLGMDPTTAESVLGRIDAAIHCAACTSFNPSDDAKVWETNVHGMGNVLGCLSGSDVTLYHVSTAYVSGGRRGIVYEHELDGLHGFTNMYESTKWLAERHIRSAFSNGDVRGAIFRPGIIVGSSIDGTISDFQNVYRFLRLIDRARNQSVPGPRTIRLEGRSDTLSNLVPVDWAAKALWQIIEDEGPSCRTYHLTNPHHNTLKEITTWANEGLSKVGTSLRLVEELAGRLSLVEALSAKALRHYLPYTKHQPCFDASNTHRVTQHSVPFPRIDSRFYDKLLAYARRNRWKCHAGGVVSDSVEGTVAAASRPHSNKRTRPFLPSVQAPVVA